jgi:hypothetical protein
MLSRQAYGDELCPPLHEDQRKTNLLYDFCDTSLLYSDLDAGTFR